MKKERLNILLLNAIDLLKQETCSNWDKDFDEYLKKELCISDDELKELELRGY